MITVNRVVERYLDYCESYYRRPDGTPTGTAQRVRSALKHLAETEDPVAPDGYMFAQSRQTLGDIPAAQMTRQRLRAVVQRMSTPDYTRSTINDTLGRIKTMFAWAAEEDLINDDLAAMLSTVKGVRAHRSKAREPRPRFAVPERYVSDLIPHLNAKVRTILMVQFYVGARPGEICSMRRSEISREHSTADVWAYLPGWHKTSNRKPGRGVRAICPGPNAIEWLTSWMMRRFECAERFDALVPPNAHLLPPEQDVIFPGRHDDRTPITPNGYYQEIRKAQRKAGQVDQDGNPLWVPYQMRNTHLTLVARHEGTAAAAAVADHSDERVTAGYLDPDLTRKLDLARRYS